MADKAHPRLGCSDVGCEVDHQVGMAELLREVPGALVHGEVTPRQVRDAIIRSWRDDRGVPR